MQFFYNYIYVYIFFRICEGKKDKNGKICFFLKMLFILYVLLYVKQFEYGFLCCVDSGVDVISG